MIDSSINFIEKLITNFTWRRLFIIAILLGLVFLCLFFYENYTGHFKLSRLNETVDIIKKADQLSPYITNSSKKNLSDTFETISNELKVFSEGEEFAFDFHKNLPKGFAAFSPWALFILLILISTKEGAGKAVAGSLLLAIPFTLIGAFLHDFEKIWINYIIYPVGSFLLSVLLILLIQKKKT